MIKKAMIRASIPFITEETAIFRDGFAYEASAKGWAKHTVQGNWLLKHINTSFAKNTVCYEQQLENLPIEIAVKKAPDSTEIQKYPFVIDLVQIYCFETGLGFCVFNFPYDSSTDEDMIANSCCILRNNGADVLSTRTKEFFEALTGSADCKPFNTQSDNAPRRMNIFSAVLCDKDPSPDAEDTYNKLCYRLANTYDARDENLKVDKNQLNFQHDYIRWCFTKRGCAVVGNLKGNKANDDFLNGAWFNSLKSNYFNLNLMVLHQKFASYHYLNNITDDPDMEHWKINQMTLTEFNHKYIFLIVSDEPFVQTAYEQLKKSANAEEVYAELQEQLKRTFDYSQIKSAEANEVTNNRLNRISVIVGVICSISVIIDSISLFSGWGWSSAFRTAKDCTYTGIIILEALVFIVFLILVLVSKKKPK